MLQEDLFGLCSGPGGHCLAAELPHISLRYRACLAIPCHGSEGEVGQEAA